MIEVETQIKGKVMTITPELAEKWLEKNTSNRPLNQNSVLFLMNQMKTGTWLTNNDAITFDSNGMLSNGQNRLTACVNSGIPFECMVMRGLEPKSFNTMDIGGIRTPSDILGANGVECPKLKSSLIKFVIDYKSGRTINNSTNKGATRITNQTILDFYEKYSRKIDEAAGVGQNVYYHHHMYSSGIVGAFTYIFNDIDKMTCEMFMQSFAKGEDLKSGSPILALRTQLMNNSQKRQKYPKADTYAWMILAWNAYRSGKKLTKILFDGQKDKFPKAV